MMGKYERTSTAVVNAALAPIVSDLRNLDRTLRDLGLQKPMLLSARRHPSNAIAAAW